MINGPGRRRCHSWIESFVEHTANLESAELYRKWSAIAMIAATLEQKVWVSTGSILYPNLYIFLIGHAGIGKSRAIMSASGIIRQALPEVYFGATSMTRAALSDYMNDAKRFIPNIPHAPLEYNSLVVVADEFSAFMHEYDSALVASLVEFYDVNPYSEGRRVGTIRIKIAKPQLNILTGSTPSNLIHTLKDYVWEQGLMSRVIMIYADDRPIIDVFNTPPMPEPVNLVHDIKIINTLMGEFNYTDDFARAMHHWKLLKLTPVPDHPKLVHYNTRRWAHLLKLTMVASVDRTNDLMLEVQDFNRAMGWLLEAEAVMGSVFQVGSIAPDSRVMDEVVHFIKQHPGAVSEHLIVNFMRERTSSVVIGPMLKTMETSRMIVAKSVDSRGMRQFIVP
jgi:energy-coupling factor transporter ATP-binding protein EcfA2